VHAKHVKEAYRLLNKSIIRVEQPDIHLDEEEQLADEPMDLVGENRDVPNAESGAMNGMHISLSHFIGQTEQVFPSFLV
jgi:DNA replication licensing factor MCM6